MIIAIVVIFAIVIIVRRLWLINFDRRLLQLIIVKWIFMIVIAVIIVVRRHFWLIVERRMFETVIVMIMIIIVIIWRRLWLIFIYQILKSEISLFCKVDVLIIIFDFEICIEHEEFDHDWCKRLITQLRKKNVDDEQKQYDVIQCWRQMQMCDFWLLSTNNERSKTKYWRMRKKLTVVRFVATIEADNQQRQKITINKNWE